MAITAGTILVGTGAAASHVGYDYGYETTADVDTQLSGQTLTGPVTLYLKNEAFISSTPNCVSSATNYLKYTYAPGCKHTGVQGTGARFKRTGDSILRFNANQVGVIVEGLELCTTAAGYFLVGIYTGGQPASGNWQFIDCLFLGVDNGVTYTNSINAFVVGSWTGSGFASILIENCVFLACAYTGLNGYATDKTILKVYNCTFVRKGDAYAVNANYGITNALVKNTICLGYGGDSGYLSYYNLDAGSVDYAGSDASGSEANFDSLQTYTNYFVTPGSYPWDLSLKAGSPFIDTGTNSVTTVDILGLSRDATTDLGAYEYGAGASTSIAPLAAYYGRMRAND
jgi:hypothetical protein